MAKELIKKTISEPQLKNEYLKLFESGNTDNTNIYEQIRTRFKIAKERHVKMYHNTLKEWQILKDISNSELIYENAKESLKSGLKSKNDRLLELQTMLADDYLQEVSTLNNQGKVIRYYRKLEPREKVAIHSEISKMDGSYTATKQEVTVKRLGKDLESEEYAD